MPKNKPLDLSFDEKLTDSLKVLEDNGFIIKVWDESIQDFRIELTDLGKNATR